MKKFVFFILLLIVTNIAISQGVAINNDGSTADNSAMLDVKSTNSGMLIPRMTQAQRNALTLPAESLIIFQTDNTPGYYYNSGTAATPVWERIATGSDLGFVDGTGVATRVAFWQDANTLSSNANLYWDDTNGRLGIGTASPSTPLYINASAHNGTALIVDRYSSGGVASIQAGPSNEYLMLEGQGTTGKVGINFYSSGHVLLAQGGGNVGIGTTSPSTKLHVNGTVRFQGLGTGTQTTGLMIDASGNVSGRTLNIANWDDAYSWGDHAAEGYLTSFSEVDPTWSGTANTTSTIGRTGSVGIGTTSPAYKLDVRNGAHVATNSGTEPFIVSRNYKTTNHEEVRIGLDDSNLNFHYVNDESASRLNFRLQNTDTEAGGGANASDYTIMTLSANSSEGRVGIGTTSPSSKLHVNGKTRTGAVNDILYVDGLYYTSIQEAIDDLPSSGGKIIIPAGTYSISSQLNLSNKSNIIIEGAGKSTIITPTTTMYLVQLYRANNIVIKNINFDCNSNSTYGMRCINLQGSTDCTIDECWFNDAYFAIYLDDDGSSYPCENNLITSNTIYNCRYGIYTNADYAATAGASINKSNRITDNNFDMNNTSSSLAIDINNYCASYILSGNTIQNTGSHGIDITYSYGMIISENSINDAGGNGIHFQGGKGLIITSNIIQNTTGEGIRGLSTINITCSNNVSIGSANTYGFYMYSVTKGTAVGNTTDKSYSFGSGFVQGYNQ